MKEIFKNYKKNSKAEANEYRDLELAIEGIQSHLLFYELEERLEMVQNAIVDAERCNGINL